MAERVDGPIYFLGNFGSPKLISLYLVASKKLCLIESGPSSLTAEILQGLRTTGYQPADVDYIALTHVHLDHAGGAWQMLRSMPRARILAFERAVKHLVEPSKLRVSASEALGELGRLWGPIEPIDPERIMTVGDHETIELGDAELEFIATTGHAPHHMSIIETSTSTLATGDAVGIYYREWNALIPASPPPSFDLEIALRNIEDLRNRRPHHLLMPHYGYTNESNSIFDLNVRMYHVWRRFLSERLRNAFDPQTLIDELAAEFESYRPVAKDPFRRRMMQVDVEGFSSYLLKQQAINR